MILINGKWVEQAEYEQGLTQPLIEQLSREQARVQELSDQHTELEAQLRKEQFKVRESNARVEHEEGKYAALSQELDEAQQKVAYLDEKLGALTCDLKYEYTRTPMWPHKVVAYSYVPIVENTGLRFPWGEGKFWKERNDLIASNIQENESVLDLGGGLCFLAEHVSGRYVSLDREIWTNVTIRADFNNGEYPDVGYFGTVVCQGLLEYLCHPVDFLKTIRKYGERLLLTYQLGPSEGRVIDLTFEALEELLTDAGWKIVRYCEVDSTSQRLYVCDRAPMWNEIKAYWWGEGKTSNWGDIFTQFIARKNYHRYLQLTDPGHAELFGCGSILEHVPDNYTGWILGAGFQYTDSRKDLTKARGPIVVRGELSALRITSRTQPIVLGDPGLLCERFARCSDGFELGVIPHYVDKRQGEVAYWSTQPGVKIIDIEVGVQEVMRQVASCRKIVSSSLHGLVIADAFGIPNRWVTLSGNVGGAGFKFYDYYSAYGEEAKSAQSIREAADNCIVRDTRAIKDRLLKAYDEALR